MKVTFFDQILLEEMGKLANVLQEEHDLIDAEREAAYIAGHTSRVVEIDARMPVLRHDIKILRGLIPTEPV